MFAFTPGIVSNSTQTSIISLEGELNFDFHFFFNEIMVISFFEIANSSGFLREGMIGSPIAIRQSFILRIGNRRILFIDFSFPINDVHSAVRNYVYARFAMGTFRNEQKCMEVN